MLGRVLSVLLVAILHHAKVDVLAVASVLVTDDQPCTAEVSHMYCMLRNRTHGRGRCKFLTAHICFDL